MTSSFNISNREIGADRCFVIVEVAQAHDGSLGNAHAFIESAARAGADAIKFQTHIAMAESTLDEPFRVKFSQQDDTRLDYWKRMEFTPEQWAGLKQHADDLKLAFLSSPFSLEAVELLENLDVPAWKIASGEAYTTRMTERLCQTNIPMLLSTGMSSLEHIDKNASLIRKHGLPLAIFQCTSAYPTPLSEVGINVLDELRDRYDCPIGLSDHSGTIYPCLMAMARGAKMIEIHGTFSKQSFGPDTSSSLTFEEVALICQARDAFEMMLTNPVDKDAKATDLAQLSKIFSKSWAPKSNIQAGTVLSTEHLTLKKPAGGFSEEQLDSLIGRTLARDVSPLHILKEEDLEP